jgi:hypothetical protein
MTLDVYADLFEDDLDDVAARLDQAREESVVGFWGGKQPVETEKAP